MMFARLLFQDGAGNCKKAYCTEVDVFLSDKIAMMAMMT